MVLRKWERKVFSKIWRKGNTNYYQVEGKMLSLKLEKRKKLVLRKLRVNVKAG